MIRRTTGARRHIIAPEIVQSSAMDCGPAVLKCLLDGHGIPVSYGRLREACQTDVDGTSIDALEEVAIQLGLNAEQVVVPADHVLLSEAALLPALVVTRLGNGATHFVVAWRRHGTVMQLMDPGTGRRWTSPRRFLDELYVHQMSIAADRWIVWTQGEEFQRVLLRRLSDIGVHPAAARRLTQSHTADGAWRPPAALDAATRLVASLVPSRAIARGSHASRMVEQLAAHACEPDGPLVIPDSFWTVRPIPSGQGPGGDLILRGAVLVTIRGLAKRAVTTSSPDLPQTVASVLEASTSRPGRHLRDLLAQDGLMTPLSIAAALLLAATGVTGEAILLRGMLSISAMVEPVVQRWAAVAALIAVLVVLTLLDCSIAAAVLGLGRRLEVRLRVAFLRKLPRLGDRYLRSRLHSDMVERSHSLQRVRHLPEVGADLLRTTFQLLLTAGGLVWLYPGSLGAVAAAAIAAITIPLLSMPVLQERDLRVRSQAGAISRFYLDALLGLVAIRAHGGEAAVQGEHESLLVEWGRAGLRVHRAAVAVEGAELLAGSSCSLLLIFSYWAAVEDIGGMLLFAYWAVSLPALGSELVSIARRYPAERNTVLRLTEPLGAPDEYGVASGASTREEPGSAPTSLDRRHGEAGIAVRFDGVTVHAGGRAILNDVSLSVAPGSHVAIVGTSGAGKSSLVGLLLGWHAPAFGRVVVDGHALDGPRLEALRRQTAWVDPEVRVWNQSLIDNLSYGAPAGATIRPDMIIGVSDLKGVLERLPDGLQTILGEGGGLVSGGEGQRVRFGRALARPDVRLAILDEPFRGLDRAQRRTLLTRARQIWRRATLLCVTHDVAETLEFDRVLVVDNGRIVEDEVPAILAGRPASHYRRLLDAEHRLGHGLWTTGQWRRLHVEAGRIVEVEA
jgi:ATP-binding cassette subfamily B protein